MKTISQITAEVEAAEATWKALRAERTKLIESRSPYKVGDEFKQWLRYKVRRVTANPNRPEVFLDCYYWTTAQKWSQGSKTVIVKVED